MHESDMGKTRNLPSTPQRGSTAVVGVTTPHRERAALSAPLIGCANISRAELILQACDLIFSAYRPDDFAKPDLFVLQLGMKLECYSDDVIRELADPRSGIQTKRKKPPSLAEITEACEDILDRRPRAPTPRQIEPPIDAAMQERIGKMLTDLADKLKDDQRERRAELIRAIDEKSRPKQQARGIAPVGISPELRAIITASPRNESSVG